MTTKTAPTTTDQSRRLTDEEIQAKQREMIRRSRRELAKNYSSAPVGEGFCRGYDPSEGER